MVSPLVSLSVGVAPECIRFKAMKKALKILVLVAIIGVIGKIIIDNA